MDSASAGLGGTSLRLRGLPGRHARVLTDGLALGGVQPDSFSFLQAPPVDLKRVEAHLAAIAHPLLERSNLLHRSRLVRL